MAEVRTSQIRKIIAAADATDKAAEENPGSPEHAQAFATEEAARRNASEAELMMADHDIAKRLE